MCREEIKYDFCCDTDDDCNDLVIGDVDVDEDHAITIVIIIKQHQQYV